MRVTIAQIKDIKKCTYAFMNFDPSCFNINDYDVVFCGDIQFKNTTNIYSMLDDIFIKFNEGPLPEDFTGHCLSVSDVVNIGSSYYYCNRFGWQQIHL